MNLPILNEILRSLVMIQLSFAGVSVGVFCAFKKHFYTTIRSAITIIGLGLIIIFVVLADAMIENMGHPFTWRIVGLWIGSLILDLGILWALWKNKLSI